MKRDSDTNKPENLTQILSDLRMGRTGAQVELFAVIYDELRRLAASQMRGERADHTLQPTALVHEAFFRLFGPNQTPFESRGHFFRAASEAMRRILVDHARHRLAVKRGGGRLRVELQEVGEEPADRSEDVLAVDEALKKLACSDSRKGCLVELRFFGGLTSEEAAAVLGISERTAKRDWNYAKAWLHREMRKTTK
jgi:RNA polymerase sigma factor (TIGR02999 family)